MFAGRQTRQRDRTFWSRRPLVREGKHADCLVQLSVHEHVQHATVGYPRYVDDVYGLRKLGVTRRELDEAVGGRVRNASSKITPASSG